MEYCDRSERSESNEIFLSAAAYRNSPAHRFELPGAGDLSARSSILEGCERIPSATAPEKPQLGASELHGRRRHPHLS